MGWLFSPTNYMVELVLAKQHSANGRTMVSGKACLGEEFYKILSAKSVSAEEMLNSPCLKTEHNAREAVKRLEAAIASWKERIWNKLVQLKTRYPNLAQTFLDVVKIQYGKVVLLIADCQQICAVGVYKIAFALLVAPLPLVASSLYSDATKQDFILDKDKPTSSSPSVDAISFKSWKWLHAAKAVCFYLSDLDIVPFFDAANFVRGVLSRLRRRLYYLIKNTKGLGNSLRFNEPLRLVTVFLNLTILFFLSAASVKFYFKMPRSRSRKKKAGGASGRDTSTKTSECANAEDSPLNAEEATSKEHNVMLCSHQNGVTHVDFGILEVSNDDKRYHDIISEPPAEYVVERYNSKKRYGLIPERYDFTLRDLIETHDREIFEPLDFSCGITRPCHWLSTVIARMIKAVNDLHAQKSFHLGLQYLENYGLRTIRNFKYDVEEFVVVLLYTNIEGGHSEHTSFEDGVELDMLALSHVIFDKLLLVEQEFKNYPADLQDFCRMTQNVKSLVGKRWLFETHPSLWYWKTRVDYVAKIWELYKNGSQDVHKKIEGALEKLNSTKKWQDKIPEDEWYISNVPDGDVYSFGRHGYLRLGAIEGMHRSCL
ncbi:hypothetical protein Vadar_016799 [Vaccinium darrowii]|uniref:Uncharacterized protein n=1 Tax=Vaccinium darrowii TaxID=229202 RepID=A0ACB7YX41_9ERIC|nr:hypothetical protein Vadar_016799 [Vaccinium darrowii]